MLRVYPLAATAENWVHETVCGKVKEALEALKAGVPIPAWTEGIRAEIRNRDALAKHFTAFCSEAAKLNQNQRDLILEALEAQNNIPAVFDGITACPRVNELPDQIKPSIKELFTAAFDLLRALQIRDRQYKIIFAHLPGKCCPFCGIEPFEAPGLAREDLDHYLAKDLYPFAGANLRNLTPMGGKCNTSYKRTQDVIRDGQGQRRRCFDPYGLDIAQISLLESRPFEGNIIGLVPVPAWHIDFIGDREATETWNEVFHIRQRYEGKADAHFHEWIEDFAIWCAREIGPVETRQQVIGSLERYISAVVHRSSGDASHLKRATLLMMLRRCQEGNIADRLAAWFSDEVRNHQCLGETRVA